MDITFCDYQALDYPTWRALWLDYTGPTAAQLTEALHQHTFSRVRDGNDALHGVIAWTDRPVGFAHYYFHPSSYSVHDACTLEDLFVCTTARRQGVARALIDWVAARAAAVKAPALNWKTRDTNTSAQALYDSVAVLTGFVAYQMRL
jgi:GNAT superfamily N-acetyltransferase